MLLKVIVGGESQVKFKNISFLKFKDLILHEGDLNLSSYEWEFGRTPSFSDESDNPEWKLKHLEEDALAEETANRPDIAGHPNNKDQFQIPQVSDDFMSSLRPKK